jgi:hypothetical protein
MNYIDKRNLLWGLFFLVFFLILILMLTIKTNSVRTVSDPAIAKEIFTACSEGGQNKDSGVYVSRNLETCADIAVRLSQRPYDEVPRKTP